MDTILSENWDAFEKRYKYWHHGLDKQGRPVAYLPFTLWNIRRATLAGERSKLSRYLAGGLERVCSKVWKLQAEGNNVTQVDLIVDLANFNIAIHACLGGCKILKVSKRVHFLIIIIFNLYRHPSVY